MKRRFAWIVLLATSAPVQLQAQEIRIGTETLTTYPYSDPDPVPNPGSLYPYFRFDGFTTVSEQKEWTVVTLENDHLRLRILPQIGGKIWSVVDKATGREMFYDNDVVKFRDIAMRGPWTSGGLEFNYGIIGHAPTCSSPVDYKTETKPDGSVSCYIGALDLLTRTHWTVEINLPKDKGWFTTRSFWHNRTGDFAPYYTWVNTGVTATDDLQLIYPATYAIGHDGRTEPWPVDTVHHRNLSRWKELDFGADKSYHMAGSRKPFFSAYWADGDFGMMHYAMRDEKLGRKFFSWALSDQGGIWKELLTDHRPQYVEFQSGRLFNQNISSSVRTPYKQFLFSPFGTDVWNEYWFPYSGTGGVEDASLLGVVNLERKEGEVTLKFSPVQNVSGDLVFLDGDGKVLRKEPVDWKISRPVRETYSLKGTLARVTLAGKEIWTSESRELSRPWNAPSGFDWDSAYGNFVQGEYAAGLRNYRDAEAWADKALACDGNYIPALVLKASMRLRARDDQAASDYAERALSVDQYDPKANYCAGMAMERLGKKHEAMDRFEIAALTTELRSAACTRLAALYFRGKDYDQALSYARKSMINNVLNMTGLKLEYLSLSALGQETSAVLRTIRELDPLDHFPDYDAENHSEMPEQEILEAMVFYHGLGLDGKAAGLAGGSDHFLIRLWKAFLTKDVPAVREIASSSPLDFVFPFRAESAEPLQWALDNGGGWEYSYLLSLLQGSLGNDKVAADLVAGVEGVDSAPFYAWRARCRKEDAAREADLLKAVELAPDQWRYCQRLTQFYRSRREYAKALAVVAPFYAKHKEVFQIGSLYVQTLADNGKWAEADKVLSRTCILPFEGQADGHALYRRIKLARARQSMVGGRWNEALKFVREAKEWPHNLGAGKPFEVDTSEEDTLEADIRARRTPRGPKQ